MIRRRSTVRRDWAVERARLELAQALSDRPSARQRLHRFAITPGWRRVTMIVVGFIGLLLVCVVIRNAPVEVWPSFAPRDPSQVLQTLWQVQAALVALGFPFLLLLIQFSHDDGVTALRSSEVLARETLVRISMELSTVGLAAAGVLAAWLPSSGSVIVAVLLITLPTTAMLLRAYFIALDLLFDRPRLRRKSSEILREKLMTSMFDLWAVQRGNALVLEELAEFGVERSYFEPDSGDGCWWSLTAPESGIIADISLSGMKAVLAAVPRAFMPAAVAPEDPTGIPPTDEDGGPPVRFLRMCGDRVRQGERVILLLRTAFALTSDPDVPLSRALRVEPVDD